METKWTIISCSNTLGQSIDWLFVENSNRWQMCNDGRCPTIMYNDGRWLTIMYNEERWPTIMYNEERWPRTHHDQWWSCHPSKLTTDCHSPSTLTTACHSPSKPCHWPPQWTSNYHSSNTSPVNFCHSPSRKPMLPITIPISFFCFQESPSLLGLSAVIVTRYRDHTYSLAVNTWYRDDKNHHALQRTPGTRITSIALPCSELPCERKKFRYDYGFILNIWYV